MAATQQEMAARRAQESNVWPETVLPTKLITIEAFCEATSTAESTVLQWIREGKLNAVTANGKYYRIPASEIDRVFQPVPTGSERPARTRPGTPRKHKE